MIKGADDIYDQLEEMDLEPLRVAINIGCQNLYKRLYGEEVSKQVFDFELPSKSESEAHKWRSILCNSLITAWADSQNRQITDKEVLFEEVLGIGEAIERSGIESNEAISMLAEFLIKN